MTALLIGVINLLRYYRLMNFMYIKKTTSGGILRFYGFSKKMLWSCLWAISSFCNIYESKVMRGYTYNMLI